MPDEGGFHHHQAMVLDTGWGFYNSTQLWQHLVITQHRVRTLQDCHTPLPHHFRLQSEVHASDHLSMDWKFQDPTVDLISLLEWLKELRETFYLQDFLFIIKGYVCKEGYKRISMEQPDEKRYIKQSMGKELWVSTSSSEGTNLPRSPGIHTSGSSLSPTHLWFYGGFITQAQLIQPLVTELNAGVREVAFKVPTH